MFKISKEIEFDAGHRVPLHDSKCRNPHGHRYRVRAVLMGTLITEGPQSGMVRDFGHVKTAMMEHVHDVFDHGFIVSELDDPLIEVFFDDGQMGLESKYGWRVILIEGFPTAEVLAELFFNILKPYIPELIRIDVFETPTSCASYEAD